MRLTDEQFKKVLDNVMKKLTFNHPPNKTIEGAIALAVELTIEEIEDLEE